MTRINFVKKARKDNPVAKKGESYYWWKFPYGGKYYSKGMPRRSSLTQSEFLANYYDFQDNLEKDVLDAETFEDLETIAENFASEIESLASEQQEKLDNMPEQLQDSNSGEILRGRQEGLEEWASTLQSIDCTCPFDSPEEGADESTVKIYVEEYNEALENVKDEIRGSDPGIN
jgi:hypothetical protein